MFSIFCFKTSFLLISSFCSFCSCAESKYLTPLNSSPSLLLSCVPETPSCSSTSNQAFETITSAFYTATSTIDATTTNGTIESLNDDNDDDNRNHSRYSNYTYFQTPILESNESDAFRIFRSRRFSSALRKLNVQSKLSVSHRERINIVASLHANCMCNADITDGNHLKSIMEMSVTPAEYHSTNSMLTSTPIMAAPIIGKDVISFDHNIFSIARVKKVELHDLSPKVPEFNGK